MYMYMYMYIIFYVYNTGQHVYTCTLHLYTHIHICAGASGLINPAVSLTVNDGPILSIMWNDSSSGFYTKGYVLNITGTHVHVHIYHACMYMYTPAMLLVKCVNQGT